MLLEKERMSAPGGDEKKSASQETKRTLLFHSHVTLEDNAFVSWLAI